MALRLDINCSCLQSLMATGVTIDNRKAFIISYLLTGFNNKVLSLIDCEYAI